MVYFVEYARYNKRVISKNYMKKLSTNEWVAVAVVIVIVAVLLLFTTLFSTARPATQNDQQKNMQQGNIQGDQLPNPSFKAEDTVIGKGDEAVVGKTVSLNYTGTLENGKVFDSSIPRGEPFTFTLGQGQVIQGWEQGILGMKVGGKRRLVIPGDMAYGNQAIPGPDGSVLIPANATLIFDVELVEVK